MIERNEIPELRDTDRLERRGSARDRLEDHLGPLDWIQQSSIDFWERVRLFCYGVVAGGIVRELIIRIIA